MGRRTQGKDNPSSSRANVPAMKPPLLQPRPAGEAELVACVLGPFVCEG